MQQLGQAGRGALTGAAMLMAARRGGDPFAILAEREAQKQQLAGLQQKALLDRIQALQDPGVRAFLQQNPEQAAAFGVPVEPTAGAAANFALGDQPGAATPIGPQAQVQGLMPNLPPIAETTEALRRRMLSGQAGLYEAALGQLGGQPGAGGAQPGGLTMTGFGPGGPTFGSRPTLTVMAGTPNPATNAPFRTGDVFEGKSVLVTPSPEGRKLRTEAGVQRTRSAGAMGMIADLRGAVERTYTAEGIADIPGQTASLYKRALEGDSDAVTIQTAIGRLPVLVEALQRDGRISDADVRLLKNNLPAFYDVKKRALAKLDAIERTLKNRNINLDAELAALEAQERGVPGATQPGGGMTPAPATPVATPVQGAAPEPNDELIRARERIRGLGTPAANVLRRAGGGPVPKGRVALVGEEGPELVEGPLRVQPLQERPPRVLGEAPNFYKKLKGARSDEDFNRLLFGK